MVIHALLLISLKISMLTVWENKRGVTLMELLIAVGIFALIAVGAAEILITGFRSNASIWERLEVQRDGRRVIQQVVNDVRQAEQSSIGGFPLVTAGTNELILYSNIDKSGYRERVRYFLDGSTLKKGIVVPSGNPLAYDTATETITEIAHHVVNVTSSVPIFSYYNTNYTGTESAMTQPVAVGSVQAIRVKLILDKQPGVAPSAYEVESVAQMRNLKLN